MLVEAGPDHPDVRSLPRDVVDASEPTVDHDWGFTADAELDRGIPLPRARIMGGCSATNACFALRGAPQDYDGWAALGNPGWSFADVLEDFRRLETDEDFRRSVARCGRPDPGAPSPAQRDEPRSIGIPRRRGRVGSSIRRGPQSTGGSRSRTDSPQCPRRHAHEYRAHVPRPGTISPEPHHPARHRGGTRAVLGHTRRPGSVSSTEPSSKPTAWCSPQERTPAR